MWAIRTRYAPAHRTRSAQCTATNNVTATVVADATEGYHSAVQNPIESQSTPLDCSAVLTHHWLVRVRGGEKVLEACAELLPDAPVYTLVYDAAGMESSPLTARSVHASWLQKLPGATRHYPKYLPLMPRAARGLKLPDVDLVLCSDAAVAKAMTSQPRSKVVCYCHSPPRYAFEPEISAEYARSLPAIVRPLWGVITKRVRAADYAAAQRVDQFIANSRHVADRIRCYYGRESVVIHPPVDLPDAPATGPREDFLLCVGYHTPYKRLDLAVAAAARLRRRLVVIGEGPEVARLRSTTSGPIEWLGWQSRSVIEDHYRRAAALLFPGEEDFGIVPVEAIAHGCPVIAYGVGGATESVVDGESGVLFAEQTPDGVCAAVERCDQLSFNPAAMHAYAQRFSRPRFLNELREVLAQALAETNEV